MTVVPSSVLYVAFAGFLSCVGASESCAQGVYDELVKAQTQMQASASIKPVSKQEWCDQLRLDQAGQKCRDFYIKQGFKQDWVGRTPYDHPGVIEVLALGGNGVLCAHHVDIQDLTPCFEMKRPDAFAANR